MARCPCGQSDCPVFERRRLVDANRRRLERMLDRAYEERRLAWAEWQAHLEKTAEAA